MSGHQNYRKIGRMQRFSNISQFNTLTKRQRISKGKSTKENQEKLATQSTQDEDKQNKNTTQYMLDTTLLKQTKIT